MSDNTAISEMPVQQRLEVKVCPDVSGSILTVAGFTVIAMLVVLTMMQFRVVDEPVADPLFLATFVLGIAAIFLYVVRPYRNYQQSVDLHSAIFYSVRRDVEEATGHKLSISDTASLISEGDLDATKNHPELKVIDGDDGIARIVIA